MSQAPTTRTPPRTPPASTPTTKGKKFTTSHGPQVKGQRVVIHGPPSAGKTSLAALIKRGKFIDRDSDGTKGMKVSRVEGIASHADAIEALQTEELWADVGTIIVDSASAFQDLAIAQVVGPPGADGKVKSIESFGFGKGYRMVYEEMMKLLAALDRHVDKGRNVVLVCHSTVGNVPNPAGEDFKQNQMDLMENGQGPLRKRVEGWADHILFIARDVAVTDGKGSSKGTRAIQTVWSPWWVAKTRPFITANDATERSLPTDIVYYDPRTDPEGAAEVWRLLGFNP